MEAKGEDVVIEIVLVNRKNVTHLIFQSPFKDLYTQSQCQFRRTCKSSFFCIIINHRFFFYSEDFQNYVKIWRLIFGTFYMLLSLNYYVKLIQQKIIKLLSFVQEAIMNTPGTDQLLVPDWISVQIMVLLFNYDYLP